MKKAFTLQLVSYNQFLRAEGFTFEEDNKTLTVGKMVPHWPYAIFISCRTTGTAELLMSILPVLKSIGCPFRLIKSQLLQYRLNAGAFGELEVGKVISIFPADQTSAIAFVEYVNAGTGHLKGPVIENTLRLGNLVYLQSLKTVGETILLGMPSTKSLPFNIPRKFQPLRDQKWLSFRYLKVETLRRSPKGDVIKAIDLRWLSFSWCLIKEGKPVALDDHFERDMEDRLLWQRTVLETIQDRVNTPRVLDFFKKKDHSFLVLEYAEGMPFGKAVTEMLQKREWKDTGRSIQKTLLGYYLQIVGLVNSLHELGFIHRDITEGNFIIQPEGKLCILDLELSYHTEKGMPAPPFVLGTPGFASPEQMQLGVPEYTDDIYSLGALLCFMLTGQHPYKFLDETPRSVEKKLLRLTANHALTNLAMRCLHLKPGKRPSITSLLDTIQNIVQTHQQLYEKDLAFNRVA